MTTDFHFSFFYVWKQNKIDLHFFIFNSLIPKNIKINACILGSFIFFASWTTKNENLCSILIFFLNLKIKNKNRQLILQFSFFSKHWKMKNENLCSIFIFIEIEKWQMTNENLCPIFIFSEHRKINKENLFQKFFFCQKKEKWKSVVNFHFFFGLITEMKLTRK